MWFLSRPILSCEDTFCEICALADLRFLDSNTCIHCPCRFSSSSFSRSCHLAFREADQHSITLDSDRFEHSHTPLSDHFSINLCISNHLTFQRKQKNLLWGPFSPLPLIMVHSFVFRSCPHLHTAISSGYQKQTYEKS
jgi:hypothetical protein